MQTFTALRDEVRVNFVSVLTFSDGTGTVCQLITNVDLLIHWEQVGNLTRVEQVVDVFEEALINDLGIREKELDSLFVDTALAQHLLDIFVPFFLTARFCDFNHEGGHGVNTGGKFGH